MLQELLNDALPDFDHFRLVVGQPVAHVKRLLDYQVFVVLREGLGKLLHFGVPQIQVEGKVMHFDLGDVHRVLVELAVVPLLSSNHTHVDWELQFRPHVLMTALELLQNLLYFLDDLLLLHVVVQGEPERVVLSVYAHDVLKVLSIRLVLHEGEVTQVDGFLDVLLVFKNTGEDDDVAQEVAVAGV